MNRGRLLVIEDEAIGADDMVYCLEEAGDSAVIASSGEEALALLQEQSVDLALVDVMLSGEMDGIETAQQLRQQHGLPMIYVTSFTNQSMLERAKLTHPSGYIVKPFKRRELLATIEMALHQSSLFSGNASGLSFHHGHLLARTWLKWEQSTLSPELRMRFQQQLAVLTPGVPNEESVLDQVLPLIETLWEGSVPDVPLQIQREVEARSVGCDALMLLELLLWGLQTCAVALPPGAPLLLEVGALRATDTNAPFLNLRPGVHSRFRIQLPHPSAALDALLESASEDALLQHFRIVAHQLKGELMLLRQQEGVSGIAMALPLGNPGQGGS